MKNSRRQLLLKIIAASVVGLFLFDRMVLSPVLSRWAEQTTRIADLREKVQRGRQLLERETTIRGRWAEMQRANLPLDVSSAENLAFKGVGRWARDSQINLTSLTPQWQSHDEGYETLECRVAATGDQASLGRFIYELETDSLPVNLEECEFTTRDPRGAQLTFTAHMTFLRLTEAKRRIR